MELLQRIAKSKEKLASVAEVLKGKFVGLDDIIDAIIDNMRVWHAMPETIERPVVINLWGMTGVGKTDLIRTLARELGMLDAFVEIQLKNSSNVDDSIEKVLSKSTLGFDQPAILLLDEIQRFRSINEDGNELDSNGFHDIWMLLSDGQFAGARNKYEIQEWMFGDAYYKQYALAESEIRKPDSEDAQEAKLQKQIQEKLLYHQSYYDARRIQSLFRLPDKIDEIMKWTDGHKMTVLNARFNDASIYEGASYKKMLIFISGNLDEIYTMANETGEADFDADLFHAFSKKITVIDIKNVLRARFKPEQIARLGNTHVIYPSLSKYSYTEIINRYVKSIVDRIESFGVNISVDQSVKDCIYRNGVYPTQGVRPVFSTINAMLGNTLPLFIMKSIEAGEDNIVISCDGDYLISKIGKEEVRQKIDRRLDAIRNKTENNKRYLVSVHECGHALIFGLLFKSAPLQIVGNSSTHERGWIGIPELGNSKQQLLDSVCVVLGGLCAEEMVFGLSGRSSGCNFDISYATSTVGGMVRNLAMGETVSKINSEFTDTTFNHNVHPTNDEIEGIIKQQKTRASSIISDHKNLFCELVAELVKNEQLSPQKYHQIMKSHGIDVNILKAESTIYEAYKSMFQKFAQI